MPENKHQKLVAKGHWITVTRKTAEETTEAGVFLPDTVRARMEPEYVGTVVNIGSRAASELPDLAVGDRIIYDHCFPMSKVGDKNEVFAMVRWDHVLASVHDEAIKPAMAPKAASFDTVGGNV